MLELTQEEKEWVLMLRNEKKRRREAAQPRVSYTSSGKRRKTYTSSKRNLRGSAHRQQLLPKAVMAMVVALTAVTACCLSTGYDHVANCRAANPGSGLASTADFLARSHEMYGRLTVAEKWTYVTSAIQSSDGYTYPSLCGHLQLCHKCWYSWCGFSRSFFYKAQREVRRHPPGLPVPLLGPGRGKKKGQNGPAWFAAHEFVDSFIESYGDPMPDDCTFQLPVSSVKELYTCYCNAIPEEDDRIKLSWFRAMMRDDYPHVRVHKYKKFKQCKYCKKCDDAVKNTKLHPDLRAKYAEKKRKHRERVRAEKQKYYHHRWKAREQPEKYVSIIIDNMDQSKLSTPGFRRDTDDTESLYKMKTHCTGVLVHGKPNRSFCYVWPDRFPKDPNLTCSILLDVLNRIDTTADVLYLQVDGASGENKNRHLFALCAYLVATGVFSKVKVSFLPVGHTHEDIDQLFSSIARALRASDFVTPGELCARIRGSLSPPPVVIDRLPRIHDFKKWFDAHMFGHWEQITRYRAYKFTLHPDGYPVCFNRQNMAGRRQLHFTLGRWHRGTLTKWNTAAAAATGQLDYIAKATAWEPRYGQKVLRSIPDRFQTCTAVPSKPLPYPLIRATVNRLVQLGLCTRSQQQAWTQYLEGFEDEDQEQCETCQELRQELLKTQQHKQDDRDTSNAKKREARAINKRFQEHLAAGGHEEEHIPWPAPYTERRQPAVRGDGAEPNPPAPGVQGVGSGSDSGADSDGDCSDSLSGVQRRKPFVIGGVVERRFHEPLPSEQEARKNTYVAVWSAPSGAQSEESDSEPDALNGYVAIGQVTGFTQEVDPDSGDSYPMVQVRWFGNSNQSPGASTDLQAPLHPGWGVDGQCHYSQKKPARRTPFVGNVYFEAVLTWGVRLARKKIKPDDLLRIQDALDASRERMQSMEMQGGNSSDNDETQSGD